MGKPQHVVSDRQKKSRQHHHLDYYQTLALTPRHHRLLRPVTLLLSADGLGICALPIEHQLERSNSAPAGIERMDSFNVGKVRNESLIHSLPQDFIPTTFVLANQEDISQQDEIILLRRSEKSRENLRRIRMKRIQTQSTNSIIHAYLLV